MPAAIFLHLVNASDTFIVTPNNTPGEMLFLILFIYFFIFRHFLLAFAFIIVFDRTAEGETGKGGERWGKTCGTFRRFGSRTDEPPGLP